MRRARIICALLAIGVLVLALARPSSASDDEAFKVIVHPDNPVGAVDRDFLRGAYLKKTTSWKDGKAILPVDLRAGVPARDRFTRDVLKKTPQQLKRYWSQQIFSGKGVPPPVADSTAAAIAYVLANPGAVGYLPAGVDPGGAKVVRLR
jgi:ABC-type phosphate transport system substrate-binding protein